MDPHLHTYAVRCMGYSSQLWDQLTLDACKRVMGALAPETQREVYLLSEGMTVDTSHEWAYLCHYNLGLDLQPLLLTYFAQLPREPDAWVQSRPLHKWLVGARTPEWDPKACVVRGAQLLTNVYPGWAVNVEVRNPLAFVPLLCEGPYERALTALFRASEGCGKVLHWATAHGFLAPYSREIGNGRMWEKLLECWAKVGK